MRELPFNVNVTLEQEKIETEDLRAALIGSLQASAQAIPQMVTQGQDPSDLVRKLAGVIKARQKGIQIEDAIEEIFEQKNPPAGAEEQSEQSPVPSAPPAPVGGAPEATPPAGPEMAGPSGAQPTMQSLLAGLNAAGNPTGGVSTRAVRPVR